LGPATRDAGDDGGEHDVLQRRAVFEQVEELEDEADVAAAEGGELAFVLSGERRAGGPGLAAPPALEPRDEGQPRRAAAARRGRRFSGVAWPRRDGRVTATNSPGATTRSTPRSARTGAPSDSNVLRRRAVLNTSGASATARL